MYIDYVLLTHHGHEVTLAGRRSDNPLFSRGTGHHDLGCHEASLKDKSASNCSTSRSFLYPGFTQTIPTVHLPSILLARYGRTYEDRSDSKCCLRLCRPRTLLCVNMLPVNVS